VNPMGSHEKGGKSRNPLKLNPLVQVGEGVNDNSGREPWGGVKWGVSVIIGPSKA